MTKSTKEQVREHVIEAAVFGRPPRKTTLPLATFSLLAVASLMLLILMYGGSRAVLEATKLTWLGIRGRPVTATITHVGTSGQVDTFGRPMRDAFEYRLNGEPPAGISRTGTVLFAPASSPQESVSANQLQLAKLAERPTLNVGQTLEFRTGTWMGRPMMHPWNPSPLRTMAFLGVSGIVVMLVSLYFLTRVVRWVLRRVTLLSYGIAVVGTIVHKYSSADESPKFYVRYGFASGEDPAGREHEEQCSIGQWKQFEVGMPVTVLYDPRNVFRSGIYKLIVAG